MFDLQYSNKSEYQTAACFRINDHHSQHAVSALAKDIDIIQGERLMQGSRQTTYKKDAESFV